MTNRLDIFLRLVFVIGGVLFARKVMAKTTNNLTIPVIPPQPFYPPEPVTTAVPTKATPYLMYFNDAEIFHRLPEGLLYQVAKAESAFDPNAVSSAGAIGLMQIIPRWHPDANPYDPIDSIYYAAGYLAQLYDRFGDWQQALAGYNWGPTNVANKGYDAAPSRTKRYVEKILEGVV